MSFDREGDDDVPYVVSSDDDADDAVRDRKFFMNVFAWSCGVMLLIWLVASYNERHHHVDRPQVAVVESHTGVVPVITDNGGIELHISPPEVHPPVVVDHPAWQEPLPDTSPSREASAFPESAPDVKHDTEPAPAAGPAPYTEPAPAPYTETQSAPVYRPRHRNHRHHTRHHFVGHHHHRVVTQGVTIDRLGDQSWLAAFCKAAAHLAGYI